MTKRFELWKLPGVRQSGRFKIPLQGVHFYMRTMFAKAHAYWASRDRDRGATAVEYGLIVALIAAVIVAIVGLLGGQIQTAFQTVCTAVNNGAAC